MRGTGLLRIIFLNSPVARWKMDDTWVYSPGLRRMTRSQGGDRQDEFLGSTATPDDLWSRQVWEEEHFLIGEAVLYMQMLAPQMVAPGRRVTGDLKEDGERIARTMKPDRGEERISPYRPDGGIECWVVLSRWAKRTENPAFGSHVFPNPKDYYLKYRISWIEKVAKVAVRHEQYDHSNRLIKGASLNSEFFAGNFVRGGGAYWTQSIMYDYRRHFRSWSIYTRTLTGPQAKAPDNWFSPEHLFREYFWRLTKMPRLKGIEEFTPTPGLYRAKFPKYRQGTSDWLFKSKEKMEYMGKTWKNHGFTDEEIDAMMNGDGVIRKEGKYFPVRRNFRPAYLFEGELLPVKFENPGPYPITK